MTDASLATPALAKSDPDTPLRLFWRKFRRHKGGVAGLLVFVAILLIVYLGPLIHTIDPNKIDIRAKNQGPSLAHPFGTDNLGHDMLAQVMAGGQISLAVGLTAMLLALLLGTLVGSSSPAFPPVGRAFDAVDGSVPGTAAFAAAARHHHAVSRYAARGLRAGNRHFSS